MVRVFGYFEASKPAPVALASEGNDWDSEQSNEAERTQVQ